MTTPSTPILSELYARLTDAIAARGLSVRQVVLRLPASTAAAMYRILAGTTSDPRASTLLALCRVIDIDPDELLDTRRAALEPEVEALLDDAKGLDEADRRLLVDLVRAFARRQSSP